MQRLRNRALRIEEARNLGRFPSNDFAQFAELNAQFLDDASAGFSVPLAMRPGPGSIVAVTDTGSAITISGREIRFSGAGPSAYASSRVTFNGLSRAAGKTLFLKSIPAATGGFSTFGWNTTNPGGSATSQILLNSGGLVRDFLLNAGTLNLSTYAAAENEFAVSLRATGYVVLQKIAGRWKVIYVHNLGTTATMFPAILRHSNAVTFRDIFVSNPQYYWQHRVLASDSFNRSNGALGSTDGLGAEERGGEALAWTAQVGTPAIASNVAVFSALSGGKGVATVECTEKDYILEATIRTGAAAGGRPGVVFRFVDSSNYWVAYIDNNANQLRIDEIASGVTTNKANPAIVAADTTSYRLLVTVDGTSINAIFNNLVLATATAATSLSASKCGIYVDTDVDVTFEDFSVKQRYADTLPSLAA